MESRPTIAVLGAGLAGLSAAVQIVRRGGRAILLERRPGPGGRAFSFTDPHTGDILDNGPHLFLGCYSATLKFLDVIGAREKIRFSRRLRIAFRDPDRGAFAFQCPGLPAPWHLLAGLLRNKGLNLSDRFLALRVGKYLRARRGTGYPELEDRTLADWLAGLGQNRAVRRVIWDPIATSALNEDPDLASAGVFARVLEETFFSGRGRSSAAGLARFGLSDLYGRPAIEYLKQNEGKVWFRARVTRIPIGPEGVQGVEMADGTRITADAYISTLAPRELLSVLPEGQIDTDAYFRNIRGLQTSPIISVHLWYDRRFLDEPFVGLLGTRTQWLFDRWSILDNHRGAGEGSPKPKGAASGLSAVISAARDYIDWPASDIIRMVVADINRCFPAAASARLLRATTVKERHATISPRVGSCRLRPGPRGPIPNLVLGGDWTDTGLPGCVEGAVRSGERAAEAALEVGSRQLIPARTRREYKSLE